MACSTELNSTTTAADADRHELSRLSPEPNLLAEFAECLSSGGYALDMRTPESLLAHIVWLARRDAKAHDDQRH
jgi:hypothetical protein